MKLLRITDNEFVDIFSDIKKRYLSKNNFPKLIVGSGLSVSFGISGMTGLSIELNKRFEATKNETLKEEWEKIQSSVTLNGLEAALLTLSQNNFDLIEEIKNITADFILSSDYKAQENILNKESGFEQLIRYLSKTVSVNNNIIDIMTPNYDLIIERVADKLNLSTTLGFTGNIYQKFNKKYLTEPHSFYCKNISVLRIFKPHGSINWVNEEYKTIQINDNSYLEKNSNHIEIIAPGIFKYEYGMTHDVFRSHREAFNEVISSEKENYSIFIYGYGFNDAHFDAIFLETSKNIIVLSKEIKQEIIDRAIEGLNWTLFYDSVIGERKTNNYSYMIHKGIRYEVDIDLWNLNVFSEVFIGGNK
ncbi:conserved hypothetical protein [Lactococcus piscium]|uniref:SIR2 family protein n=1 Tax=Pseudolactococcus carnosus TaxID=2749961 RepID=UPI000BC7E8F4|nr:SIR2 family protein [Lactococcus carnosus]SOB48993.1 conserved hypothetical protein [Lactococcus piscium]MCJ1973066.1 hypothetical protein [Lactococcus carnosus]MCJ1975560.1 hypothetical protein [Lactococcus carnosus]MCJ1985805.1 hypothetical protein [Lactococcus carnosus]MCJ1987422.1 hypothetical protein [Lactococcus carnosus]